MAEWNSGQLSRYEPKSGKWSSWKAPGEAPQVYAVYVRQIHGRKGEVWTPESGADKIVVYRYK